MKPNVKLHNPDPNYIRGLIEKSGLDHDALSKRLGICTRSIRLYVADLDVKTRRDTPYCIQYALEQLAK